MKSWVRFKEVLGVALLIGVAGLFFYRSPIVTAPPLEEAERILEACKEVVKDQTGHEQCTAKEFATVGERRGVVFIGEVLSAYQSLSDGYEGYQNCHVLAHRIMSDLGSREPGKWRELLEQLASTQLDLTRCGGGFMHGILEVRASEDPSFKVNAALFEELCQNTVAPQSSTSCAHILGHLALIETAGEVEEALKLCNGLSGDFLFQCYGGIFMEDSMRTNLKVHGLAELPERNLKWFETQRARCERYRDKPEVVSGCWYDLPEVFAQTHNYDLGQTYAFCATAPSRTAEDHCYTRASYLVALVPTNLFKNSYTKELCATYQSGSNELNRCMQDVVGASLSGSMQLIERVLAFCSERLDEAKAQCYRLVSGQVTRSASSFEEKKRLCAKLPSEHQPFCIR